MRNSIWMVAPLAALLLASTPTLALDTTVDTAAQSVRVDFSNLPAYEQIRLVGVDALYWCSCLDLDNPSSLMGTGFTVNGNDLEMQYGGAPPPSTNFITYQYLDGYLLNGFEQIEWAVVSLVGGGELHLTGDRPILVPLPEPSSASLCLAGATLMALAKRSGRRTPESV